MQRDTARDVLQQRLRQQGISLAEASPADIHIVGKVVWKVTRV